MRYPMIPYPPASIGGVLKAFSSLQASWWHSGPEHSLCSYSQEGATQCGDFPRRSVSRVIVISPEPGWLHPLAWLVISGPHLLPPPRGAGGGRPQGSARILSRAPSPYHRAEMYQTPSASAEPPDWKVNPDSRHLACLFSPPRDHYLPTRSSCPFFCLRA